MRYRKLSSFELFSFVLILMREVQRAQCDNFKPTVKASCVGSKMIIRVDTVEPFEGIIHGPNRSLLGCSVLGRGALKTYLRIDLSSSDESEGACGVKINKRAEERKLAIAVRAHPTIELNKDRLFVVSCGRAGYQNSQSAVSVVALKVVLPGDTTHKQRNTVLEGEEYKLRLEVVDHDPEFSILIRRCFAFDESESSLQLIDERGCVIDKLMSEFEYNTIEGSAEATIYSMFRLPHSDRTYFQCDVAICRSQCPIPNCGTTIASEIGLQKLPADVDPFDRPEDDAVTTSTSVFIARPGSEESVNAIYCTGAEISSPGDLDYIKWLCIAFGILFGIMLLINIFLCSAMTCSCTKSEIIEKEPSVYDDYSLYESQYGYNNNGKVYGSESDYGSEYGTVEHEAEPSESGTIHSKYNSTLFTRGKPLH